MTNNFDTFMNLINTTDFVEYYDGGIIVHDFAGFDENWDEVMNDLDDEAVRRICLLANAFGIEVEFTSEDI